MTLQVLPTAVAHTQDAINIGPDRCIALEYAQLEHVGKF